MKHTITFKIVTPERVAYEAEIDRLTVPTRMGEVTVLANHIPLISLLAAGEMVVHQGGEQHSFAIADGLLEVKPDSAVIILADVAERAEEIDEARAEAARARAAQMLAEKDTLDAEQFARFQGILEREMAKIKVARKHRGAF